MSASECCNQSQLGGYMKHTRRQAEEREYEVTKEHAESAADRDHRLSETTDNWTPEHEQRSGELFGRL